MPWISRKFRILCFILLIVIIFLTFLRCEGNNIRADQSILAIVGERVIDKDSFIKRYKDFRRRTGASDNGQARRSILNNTISEELLIIEARKRNYDDDAVGQHEYERIKIQELLNAYHRQFISKSVSITEEELKALFINLNTKISARHLYASTREKADSLYTLLQQGASFENLARTTFKDPVLRESGGSLGYFTVDEMDPAFEEAAYFLKIGEISQPVRTGDGYSIIRVDDRKGNPLVTENEFAKHRPKLEAYWKKRKTIRAAQQHTDSLRKELNITFNESIVHELYSRLKDERGKEFFQENEISQKDIPDLQNMELVYSESGPWNVRKFQEFARYTSKKQHGWIRNIENLKDFIAGLVVRSNLLAKTKKHKLHKTREYKERVAEQFDISLLERIEKDLYQEFEIPEDSLRQYFNEEPTQFAEPPKIRLKEIVLAAEDKIDFIRSQLRAGVDFSELAKKHSVIPSSATRGGDLGYLSSDDLGKWSGKVMAMKPDTWAGPLRMNSYHVFLKCIDKMPLRIRSYEEARYDVEQAVRTFWWDRVRGEKLQELRETVIVESFPERLLKTQLN